MLSRLGGIIFERDLRKQKYAPIIPISKARSSGPEFFTKNGVYFCLKRYRLPITPRSNLTLEIFLLLGYMARLAFGKACRSLPFFMTRFTRLMEDLFGVSRCI